MKGWGSLGDGVWGIRYDNDEVMSYDSGSDILRSLVGLAYGR